MSECHSRIYEWQEFAGNVEHIWSTNPTYTHTQAFQKECNGMRDNIVKQTDNNQTIAQKLIN